MQKVAQLWIPAPSPDFTVVNKTNLKNKKGGDSHENIWYKAQHNSNACLLKSKLHGDYSQETMHRIVACASCHAVSSSATYTPSSSKAKGKNCVGSRFWQDILIAQPWNDFTSSFSFPLLLLLIYFSSSPGLICNNGQYEQVKQSETTVSSSSPGNYCSIQMSSA